MKFDWLFNSPIAHRGLHDEKYPENSMPAFAKAIEYGFNIEIDVHLTADKQIVVFHDDNLKRVCGLDKPVKACTLKELKKLRLCGSEYAIPTLDEFLELVKGQVGILCEIKGVLPWELDISKAVLDRLKNYDGNIALQSFNFGAVRYCIKHSDLPCGQLCTWHGTKPGQSRSHLVDFMGKLWVLRISKPHFAAYDVRAMDKRYPENKYVKKWNKRLPFLIWTVNDEEKLKIALEYANNIIFENMDISIIKQETLDRRVWNN